MSNFVCKWRQSVPVENLWKTLYNCGKLYSYVILWFLCNLCVYYESYVTYVYTMNLILFKYTRFIRLLCNLCNLCS